MNIRLYWHYADEPFVINETRILNMPHLLQYVDDVARQEIIIVRMVGVV